MRTIVAGNGHYLVWAGTRHVMRGEIDVCKHHVTVSIVFRRLFHLNRGGDGQICLVYAQTKHVPLSKLCCVTTDGANSMVGKVNGMVVYQKNLIDNEVGDQHRRFYSVWCLSHRLDLVIRAFATVDHIKNDLKFLDWFSPKRKAVAHRKWLCENKPDKNYKKIPKPSETRWCFYRDVIKALLTQIKEN